MDKVFVPVVVIVVALFNAPPNLTSFPTMVAPLLAVVESFGRVIVLLMPFTLLVILPPVLLKVLVVEPDNTVAGDLLFKVPVVASATNTLSAVLPD